MADNNGKLQRKEKVGNMRSSGHNCAKCTNIGCDQLEVGECWNEGYSSGKLLNAGR